MSGSKPLDVLGVGCNSVDYVYRLPAAPRADSPTAKMRIHSHSVFCGGQTATAMAACAALGLRAGYLGAVGNVEILVCDERVVADERHQATACSVSAP